jgi:uncharacterized protein YbbC (DUF1343 family)
MTVRFGVDQVVDGIDHLPSGRVAMLTNDAARLSDAPDVASRSALLRAGVDVVRLFSPEHGLGARAADGAHVGDGRDALTGLAITSLYGDRLAPAPEQLDGIDAVVVDLPDAGARFYTYAWTMTHVLDACAAAGVPVVVLDRPNPLGGVMRDAEGPLLESDYYSLLGRSSVPIRHSLTIGELARLWTIERASSLDLRVVRCAEWRRELHWPDTELSFVPMSPALTSYETALCYPGICLFEATNVDVGRGTTRPFRQLAAPWLDAKRIAERCAGHERLRGLSLEPEGSVLRLEVADRGAFRPVHAAVTLLEAIRRTHEAQFRWAAYPTVANPSGDGHLERLAGSRSLRALIDDGAEVPEALFGVGDWDRRTSAARLYD